MNRNNFNNDYNNESNNNHEHPYNHDYAPNNYNQNEDSEQYSMENATISDYNAPDFSTCEKTMGGKHYVKSKYRKFIVTDEYLLEYLLKKYRLEKSKLIHMIENQKKHEYIISIIEFFYKENKEIKNKPIKDQYKYFKQWNESGLKISIEDLDNYYENKIKKYN
ncbi:hypothetical protein [Bandra megavirus]|uniref:Uncharacterized protein n=1 Tax=Bandra megavirus TaxID=2071566 RepID=A0A2K9V7S7_9VIRU|nr:hypothetical protein [Bandra megavirus]